MKSAEHRRTAAAPQSTRDRILAAALELFSQHGYAGTSVRELARRVGIRESSLYNHFESKAAILDALMKEYGPASSASWLEQPRYRALVQDPTAFCRQYALDLVSLWSDPREHQFQKVITAERNRIPGLRAQYADQLYSREQRLMTDYFRKFAFAGLIATSDPKETARLFMAALTYIRLEHYIIGPRPSPREQVVHAIDRFLAFFLDLTGVSKKDGKAAGAATNQRRPKPRKR
jgi:AcrR family transcriptional regulator